MDSLKYRHIEYGRAKLTTDLVSFKTQKYVVFLMGKDIYIRSRTNKEIMSKVLELNAERISSTLITAAVVTHILTRFNIKHTHTCINTHAHVPLRN